MTPKTSPDPLYDRIAQSFRSQAFLTLLGAQLRSVAPGKVVISCRPGLSWDSSRACSTGGVVATIADVTCGYTALTTMPEGYEVLTAEFKINLLRPVLARRLCHRPGDQRLAAPW